MAFQSLFNINTLSRKVIFGLIIIGLIPILLGTVYISSVTTSSIENFDIDEDNEDGDTITATGYFLLNTLSRRSILTQTNKNKKSELAMRELVDENAINPTDPNRKIENLILGTYNDFTETVNFQVTGAVLSEYLGKSTDELVKECAKSMEQSIINDISQAFERSINNDTLLSYSNYKTSWLEKIKYKLITIKNKIFKRHTDDEDWYSDDEYDE
jgi:hypothetical protein